MAIRYLPLPPKELREYVQPIPDSSFIFWLFHYRCIICKQPASEVNEIIPRSRSKYSISDWRNRVTLCKTCHNEYHKNGVNRDTIKEMQKKRNEFLLTFDRKEYADNTDFFSGIDVKPSSV